MTPPLKTVLRFAAVLGVAALLSACHYHAGPYVAYSGYTGYGAYGHGGGHGFHHRHYPRYRHYYHGY